VRVEEQRIAARDGFLLEGSTFEPDRTGAGFRVVLINSATAVKRSYYRRYAAFLAEEGLAVVTYDYRGVGGSRPGDGATVAARMSEWAEQDAAGVLEWILRRWPDAPVVVVGHSFGGQALGLIPGVDRVTRALLVASQSGYWRHWPGVWRWRTWLLWYFLMPGLSHAVGYFPGRLAGLGENLPKGVALDWARWGRHPDYILEGDPARHDAYARLRIPIRAYSFPDDHFAPAVSVDALLSFYRGAAVEHRHLTPRELGVEAIGHWGFFRETFRPTLWRESLEWLRGEGAAAVSPAPNGPAGPGRDSRPART
jgi:predicted alpha/beta hydrolase